MDLNIGGAVMEFENTSGHGMYSNVPVELKRWNWGAFWLTWIWGIFNRSYIALLAFVPIVNLIIPFYLGASGNELAWRNNEWMDVQEFNKIQWKWAIGGWIFALICVLSLVGQVIHLNKQDKINQSITNQIITKIESNEKVKKILGDDYKIMDSSTMMGDTSNKEFPMIQITTIQANFDILVIYTSLNKDYSIRTITVTLPNDEKILIE